MTEHEKLVEKVARAAGSQISEGIGAVLRKFCDSPEAEKVRAYLHAMPPSDWETLVVMLGDASARAALSVIREALSEPSPDQIVAGQEVFLDNGYSHAELHDGTLRKAFRAMIAASPIGEK